MQVCAPGNNSYGFEKNNDETFAMKPSSMLNLNQQ